MCLNLSPFSSTKTIVFYGIEVIKNATYLCGSCHLQGPLVKWEK